MTFEEVQELLRHPEGRTKETSKLLKMALQELKAAAVEERDHNTSKHAWCLEEVLDIQDHYAAAFVYMKEGKFREAWRALVNVETGLGRLSKHHSFDDYHMHFVRVHSIQFQRLLPFKLFFSIGSIVKERRCGLCDAVITPRRGCHHRKGEIYDGEMCFHVITQASVDHVAIVDEPADKNCILIAPGLEDSRRYAPIEYVVSCLESPYHSWEVCETRVRHPHHYFAEVGKDEPCPCGADRTYEVCCLGEDGVLRPHFEFSFEVAPPDELLKIRYYYDDGQHG